MNATVAINTGRKKVKPRSFGEDCSSMVNTQAMTKQMYPPVTSNPCHVAGVHPQPNNFRLNQ